MKYLLPFFLFLVCNKLYCQVTIVNDFNTPISFVELYSNNQILLAQSNDNGKIPWKMFQNLNLNDTIYFNHINYFSKWALRKNIKNNDTIILTVINHRLPEVVVSSVTTNNDSKKYQSINACYRSYQTNNDSLIYYTDGLVDYISKTNKIKYQNRLNQFRIYVDTNYVSERKERNISFRCARVSMPLTEYLPKKYFNSNGIILNKNTDGTIHIFSQDKTKIGTIKKNSSFVTYVYDDLLSNKSRSSGKFKAIQLKTKVTLVFKPNNNDVDFLINSFDNLVYSKIQRHYNIKHDTENEFTRVNNIEEIFIEGINYIDEIETKNYSKGFGFPKGNNYQSSFWEKCKCELYSPSPVDPLQD